MRRCAIRRPTASCRATQTTSYTKTSKRKIPPGFQHAKGLSTASKGRTTAPRGWRRSDHRSNHSGNRSHRSDGAFCIARDWRHAPSAIISAAVALMKPQSAIEITGCRNRDPANAPGRNPLKRWVSMYRHRTLQLGDTVVTARCTRKKRLRPDALGKLAGTAQRDKSSSARTHVKTFRSRPPVRGPSRRNMTVACSDRMMIRQQSEVQTPPSRRHRRPQKQMQLRAQKPATSRVSIYVRRFQPGHQC